MILVALLVGALSVHPAQAEVFAAATDADGPSTVLARAGIRGGKTEVGAGAAIVRAMTQPTAEDECHAVVSPTFPMSKLGPEPKLRKLFGDRQVFPESPLIRYAKSERTFYVQNTAGGISKLRIFSGEDPDRWRGDKWRSAWLDEGAYLDDDARDVAIGRLADTNGQMIITSSPDGLNWVSEYSDEATELEERWIVRPGLDGKPMRVRYFVRRSPSGDVLEVEWSSLANPFVKLDGFEKLRKRYDPETYDQEVNAQYVARSGRVYKYFDRKTCGATMPAPDGLIYVGQDFNVARMATVFLQDRKITKAGEPGLHVFAEHELRDADTHKLVRFLNDWLATRRISKARVVIMPDASGRKRSTAADSDTAKSDLEILARAGFAIDAPRGNPRVKDRVNCVNGLFANGRLTVDIEKCPLLVEALEKQPWGDDGEPEKDGKLDNRTDALGYPCWRKFPLRRETVLGRAA